jgi:hypothetical protein
MFIWLQLRGTTFSNFGFLGAITSEANILALFGGGMRSGWRVVTQYLSKLRQISKLCSLKPARPPIQAKLNQQYSRIVSLID